MNEARDPPRSPAPLMVGSDQDQGGTSPSPQNESDIAGGAMRRLWTPWRMAYVGGSAREVGCIFCDRLLANDDARTLILHRGKRVFTIMNLFPYNTGHVMIVPNEHIASPEDGDADTLTEMAALRSTLLRALRRALTAEGFNVGMNVGAVAGAGVADHFHEHVVPRWQGDANFMPILAATMVIPELIPVTYGKLRAELVRELTGNLEATLVIQARDGSGVVIGAAGELPVATALSGEPTWRAVARAAERLGALRPEILGWAGDSRSGGTSVVLAVQADLAAPEGYRVASVEELASTSVAPLVRAARRLSERQDPH